MKQFFKTLKAGLLLTGIVSLVLGLLMLLFPSPVRDLLRWILGGGLVLFGVLEVVSVFARPNGLMSVGRMIPGILCMTVGLVFLFRYATYGSLIWTLIAMALLVDAIYKLQYSFEMKAKGVSAWWWNLLTSLLGILFAVVLIVEPSFSGPDGMTLLAGAFLVTNSIFDFICLGYMSHAATLPVKSGADPSRSEEKSEETGLVQKETVK